ncbi:MAG: T9SS type A sorting domain-containing protein [Bacteroidales bacterium]|nr:T9SS type A sorting domain-containing protein [Bacteroidales bacterium]
MKNCFKKIFLLALLGLSAGAANAQEILLNENFNSIYIPTGQYTWCPGLDWNFVDNDYDGQDWRFTRLEIMGGAMVDCPNSLYAVGEGMPFITCEGENDFYGQIQQIITPYQGNGCLFSLSYSEVPMNLPPVFGDPPCIDELDPDNWAILYDVYVPSDGLTLSWYVLGHSSYPDNYQVKIVESQNYTGLSSFTDIYTGTTPSHWEQRSVTIPSSYAGNYIHIAFVHSNSYNNFLCAIDAEDIWMLSNPPYSQQYVRGSGTVTGTTFQQQSVYIPNPGFSWRVVIRHDSGQLLAIDDVKITGGNVNGIDEVSENSIVIYPNPAKDHIVIAGSTRNPQQDVQIFDISGRTVETWHATSLQNGTAIVNVSHLPSGVYFLKIGYKTAKFVKE